MSAVMQATPTRLEFPITRAMPRKLIISLQNDELGFYLHAQAFVGSGYQLRAIAFGAAHKVDDARLLYTATGPILWLRSTQFDLTTAEAVEVERVLQPLGIRVERAESQS